MKLVRRLMICGWPVLLWAGPACGQPSERAAPGNRPNILFILIDDMRWDAMSGVGHPVIETPAIDRLAQDGVRFANAFVTTSLCSPSRASMLTGLYAHVHNVMNNATRLDESLPTFPKLLQQAGYQTAFFGKWHMGGASDEPRPGFDHWASFRGQGDYFKNNFNINGQHRRVEGYITDVLTDMAVEWISTHRNGPFMAYVSHKAVHGFYEPAPRYADVYRDVKVELPASSLDTPDNYHRKPHWVREQRDSWHGINDAYFKKMSMEQVMRDYWRCMRAVDDSVERLTQTLRNVGRFDNTLILLAGDNGFLLGEHGLIDKRCMYEESIRIPLIISCPRLFSGGQVLEHLVLNVDFAPTFLEAAGMAVPSSMQGRSFLTLPSRPEQPWRKSFLYEYFWEAAYPETPSLLGVRTDRHKYVEYQGVWDTNELYDLEQDPREMHNRISTSRRKQVSVDPEYQPTYRELRQELGRLKTELGVADVPNWRGR